MTLSGVKHEKFYCNKWRNIYFSINIICCFNNSRKPIDEFVILILPLLPKYFHIFRKAGTYKFLLRAGS